MSSRRRRVRGLVALSALLLGTSMLSACDNGDDIAAAARPTTPRAPPPTPAATRPRRVRRSADAEDPDAGSVSTNIKRKTDVPVSTQLLVFAHNGRLSTVTVSGSGDVGALTGAIAGDGGKWKADDLLEPGTTYTVKASVAGDDGERRDQEAAVHHPGALPLPADLPLGRAAARRDRRRRHAGDRDLRRPRHRPGQHREAPARDHDARAAGHLALAQRHRGPLPPEEVLEGRHPGRRQRSTSTASTPATASTARRTATSSSRSATPTSTRSTPGPTR